MEKIYNFQEKEKDTYKQWEAHKSFSPKVKKGELPFTVVIPPPNVTGSLHMGHALNNTIQDTLVRWQRMKGRPTLWIPGTDHAGIATQNIVEKKLAKEDKDRFSVGRDEFVQEVWRWKGEYEERILNQLKTLGCSCDWDRTRFTMDKDYTKAVLEAFVHYWEKGYLYRGHRITNWCPRCETSLSDLEVEHEEAKGHLWFIRYDLVGGGSITVATTRPETMLGDTAIAVNPEDKRHKNLIGKEAILPILKRKIPIIADKAIDLKFGTGAVKVTPAHDATDYEIGERHNLEKVIVIDKKGRMTKEAGESFYGLDRYKARKAVLDALEKEGLLEKTMDHIHSIGHCYRCQTVIEPLLTQQWFVKMDELAKPAIKAVEDGSVSFHPNKWKKVYLDWMHNLKDWNISRQIWWGHQLPVWYCDCGEIIVSEEWALEDEGDSISEKKLKDVSRLSDRNEVKADETSNSRKCPKCGTNNPRRDKDVLDTWFSSALWPFAVFGWPEKTEDLDYFYPTTFLSTARDIIYLWVARMIFSGLEFMNKPPFADVYVHATVFNKEGRRMSKSLGTGVDPLELIEKYGADATRFGLLWQVAQGQDMKFGEDALLNGKRFVNKLWNASKFTLMNLEDYKNVSRETSRAKSKDETFENKIKPKLTEADKKILKSLNNTIDKTEKYLSKYDFQHAIENIYDFFWHDFCDVYIEETKTRIKENEDTKEAAQYVLHTVLKNSLKLLHPFMPFVTEEIWKNLDEKNLLITSSWPEKEKF